MEVKEFKVESADGLALFFCRFTMKGTSPKAVVCLIHGMGEHSGKYRHVVETLVKANYSVITYDQRGHGQSAGKRGDTPSYEMLMKDVDLLLHEAETNFPVLPIFVYGHSMGGNVALNYAMRRQPKLKGLIVSGPWLQLTTKPSKISIAMAAVMRVVYPTFTVLRKQKPEQLTREESFVQAFRHDQLVHDKITARFFLSVNNAGRWASAHADQISVPLLLMHGSDDQVTSVKASRAFGGRSAFCTYKEWSGSYHELHNDVNRKEVLAHVVQWVGQQL